MGEKAPKGKPLSIEELRELRKSGLSTTGKTIEEPVSRGGRVEPADPLYKIEREPSEDDES